MPNDARRYFVGIQVPESVWLPEIVVKGWRTISLEKRHVTLVPPIENLDLLGVKAKVRQARRLFQGDRSERFADSLSLELMGYRLFPSPKNCRVIAARVHGCSRFRDLYDSLRISFDGRTRFSREFIPHVTICKGETSNKTLTLPAYLLQEFSFDDLCIYEVIRQPGEETRYEIVSRIPLHE